MRPLSKSILLVVFALAAPAVSHAQVIAPNVINSMRAPKDTNSLTERVNLLEAALKKDEAMIADLQQKLVEQRDMEKQNLAPVQQSASQAYNAAAQAQASATTAQAGVNTLNEKAAKWDAVAQSYPSHTHTYDGTGLNYQSTQCDKASGGSTPCSWVNGVTHPKWQTGGPQ